MKAITKPILQLTLVTVMAIGLLAFTGCQSGGGFGAAVNQTFRPIAEYEQRTTSAYTIGPDGKTNAFFTETVTNHYPSNLVGQTYLAENKKTLKHLHATYFIGGGDIQGFSTTYVNALGTVDSTSFGSSHADVNTNALGQLVAGLTNITAAAISAAITAAK